MKISFDPDGTSYSDKPAPTISEMTRSLRAASSGGSDPPVMETAQEAIMRQLRESLPAMDVSGGSKEAHFQKMLLEQFDKEAALTDRAKRIERPTSGVNLYAEELAEYGGQDDDKPIYISVKRQIYDVTDGVRHYGPKGRYKYLAGREVGRALATGCFESTGLSYDTRGLSMDQVREIREWQDFFAKKYKQVGLLKGKKIDDKMPIPTDNCEEAERYEGRPGLEKAKQKK